MWLKEVCKTPFLSSCHPGTHPASVQTQILKAFLQGEGVLSNVKYMHGANLEEV